MRNLSIKAVLISMIILSLTGCNKFHDELTIKEVDLSKIDSTFYEGPNFQGINFVTNEDETIFYVILSAKDYPNPTDYSVSSKDGVISIKFNGDFSKKQDAEHRLYEVKKDKEYEQISAFINDEEVSINTIFAN